MADPNSFRAMRIVNINGGNEAEIAVSDYDSRKHLILEPPKGAGPDWMPPADKAPEGERLPVQWADEPPSETHQVSEIEAGQPQAAKPLHASSGRKVGEAVATAKAEQVVAGRARAAKGARGANGKGKARGAKGAGAALKTPGVEGAAKAPRKARR